MNTTRRLSLTVLAIATFVASVASAGDDEWERPFTGVLPEPEEDVSVNPREADAPKPLPWAATYIVDGATGRPLPGATLTLHPEDISMGATSYARKLGGTTANANGLAWLDASGWPEGGHWVAEAPGYGPGEEFAYRPPSRMPLGRGTDLVARVFDVMGRPVQGADVEAYLGCHHAGTLRRVRTAKDGSFTLTSMPHAETSFWMTSPGGCLGFASGLGGLGRRPSDVLLLAARTVRGQFVDAKGAAIVGVVVRATGDFDRAPIAVSDADGRFELVGIPGDAGLHFLAPGAESDDLVDDDNLGPLPLVVRLDADGTLVEPEDDAEIVLRVTTPDGAPVDEETIRMTRISDGWSFTVTTGNGKSEPGGTALADVPSGSYDVAVATPFEPAAFSQFRWEIAAGGTAERKLVATPQPTIDVQGTAPRGGRLVLGAAGDDWWRSDDFESWHPHVPADEPAVLAVQPFTDQRVVFFFPVGAPKDGVRSVVIDVPPPHRVRIDGIDEMQVDEFTCDGLAVAYASDGPALSTYADGPMVLDAELEGKVRRFTFDLAAGAGGEIVLDPASGDPVSGDGMVRVIAEGPKAWVQLEGPNVRVTGGTRAESLPPCRVVISRPGHQPFDRWFTEPAEVRHPWGTCALHLLVRDTAGEPVPSIVQVDGVSHWTADGALDLAGLTAGPHAVVVAPIRTDVVGRELRLVLVEGETRTREVVVPGR